MKRAFTTHSQGMAGVYAVASRLCLLGHTPFFPSVDFGVDMMLDNGLKLQVKCGHLRQHPGYKQGVYSFDIRKAFKIVGHTVYKHQKERTYAGTCDFVIFWAIEENRFFIIPAGSINGCVWIPSRGCFMCKRQKPTVSGGILAHEEAWHLLDMDGVLDEVERVAKSRIKVKVSDQTDMFKEI